MMVMAIPIIALVLDTIVRIDSIRWLVNENCSDGALTIVDEYFGGGR